MSREEFKKYVTELYRQGLSYSKIGLLLNMSRQRVHQIITGYKSPSSRSTGVLIENKKLVAKYLNLDIKNLPPNPIKEGQRDRVREYVRIRDNRTCQVCHKQWKEGERRLDVHHLDEDMQSKSHEKGATKWDLEHLDRMITLCHKCHFNLDMFRNKPYKTKKLSTVSVKNT